MTGQQNRTKFLTNYMAMAMRTSKHRVISLRHWYAKKFEMANEAFERIDRVDHGQEIERIYDSRKINFTPVFDNSKEKRENLERILNSNKPYCKR